MLRPKILLVLRREEIPSSPKTASRQPTLKHLVIHCVVDTGCLIFRCAVSTGHLKAQRGRNVLPRPRRQCLFFSSSALISCCPERPLSGFSAFNAKQTLMEAGCYLIQQNLYCVVRLFKRRTGPD